MTPPLLVHTADLALAALALEVAVIAWFRPRALRAVLAAALPGGALIVALRLALADAAWPWVPLMLAAALPAHLLDLRIRLREDAPPDRSGGGASP